MALNKTQIAALCVGNEQERYRAAKLTKCPPEFLAKFANDTSPGWLGARIQYAALANPACPVDTLADALKETMTSDSVRLHAAISNPKTTTAQLAKVAETHGYPPTETDSLTTARSQSDLAAVGDWILGHPNCPRELMDWVINCPIYLKQSLTGHASWQVYEGLDLLHFLGVKALINLAVNHALPEDIARILLRHRMNSVRQRAAINKSVPVALLDELTTEKAPIVLTQMVKRLTGEPQAAAMAMLLKKTTGTVLAKLAVAKYSTEPEMITSLCMDGHPRIRARAAENTIATETDKVVVALLR